MADTAGAPEPKAIPSFKAVVEEGRVTAAPADSAAPAAAAAAPDDAYDFEKAYGELPERLRKDAEERISRNAYEQFNSALATEYGDILPLIVEAREDPKFRKALAGLTDKQVRDFLFDDAMPVYERTRGTSAPPVAGEPTVNADPRVKELEEKYTALEAKMGAEDAKRGYDQYQGSRLREMEALQNEAGDELRWTAQTDPQFKLAAHLIQIAEDRSERAARTAGIDTGSGSWYAQALAKGVRLPSYRDVYDEYKEISGRTAPPAAPATSAAGPPRQVQAPRDASEGKQRALTLLNKVGGLRGLASVSSKVRR